MLLLLFAAAKNIILLIFCGRLSLFSQKRKEKKRKSRGAVVWRGRRQEHY
jgi:hypothetical protein